MKINIPKVYLAVASVCFILLSAGCSKNVINIIGAPESEESGSSGNNQNGNGTLITFQGSIESLIQTRSMSPINTGIKAELFAYNSASGSLTKSPEEEGVYFASSPGVLTGLDGYKMYLSSGIYNFYGVSLHLDQYQLSFTNGKSGRLYNGVDYLWWKATEQDISESQVFMPIVFLHRCTQVVVQVVAGNGITLNKLVGATIVAPDQETQLDLFTGVIPATNTLNSRNKMGINEFTAQYIMLPVKTDQPMTMTLDIQVNNETVSRNYEVDIPIPNGELISGNSYLFRAIVNENTVSFGNASIKSWTEVDETGSPLYPID